MMKKKNGNFSFSSSPTDFLLISIRFTFEFIHLCFVPLTPSPWLWVYLMPASHFKFYSLFNGVAWHELLQPIQSAARASGWWWLCTYAKLVYTASNNLNWIFLNSFSGKLLLGEGTSMHYTLAEWCCLLYGVRGEWLLLVFIFIYFERNLSFRIQRIGDLNWKMLKLKNKGEYNTKQSIR